MNHVLAMHNTALNWLAMSVVLGPLLVIAAALALPAWPRHGLLFGVRVSDEFLRSEEARRQRRSFLQAFALLTIVVVALAMWGFMQGPHSLVAECFGVQVIGGMALWVRQWKRIQPYRVAHPIERTATLVPSSSGPGYFWLQNLLVLTPLLAAGAVLYLRWDSVPLRFPIHWDIYGAANGWATRAPGSVFGPAVFGMVMVAWIGAMEWFFVRRLTQVAQPSMRHTLILVLRGAQWLLSFTFAIIACVPLVQNAGGYFYALILVHILLLLALIVWLAFRITRSRGEPPDNTTPDDAWKWGLVYFNPADAAIMVPKRMGFGWTLNFGNPSAWLAMGMIVAVPLIATHLLHAFLRH